MDEVIHIYLDGLLDANGQHVSATKKRLWPSIIISLRWILGNQISDRTIIHNGIGVIAINSLAIAVEGFLGDLLVEYFDDGELEKPQKIKTIESSNWKSKVKIYNQTFEKSIDKCASYKSIEVLFLLRNNTSHGKTHREIGVAKTEKSNVRKISSSDKNYQSARTYLQDLKLLDQNVDFSNIEILWRIDIIVFFFNEVRFFLYDLLENNKSDKFGSIASELNNAYRMTV